MSAAPELVFTRHDDLPRAEASLVDRGLGEANDRAAPLHEVRPLSCFARRPDGTVMGGAVGRTWGGCCELQQLWVDPAHRRQGIGARLVKEFEAAAIARGCASFYLDTFSFQAPELYRALGYAVAYAHAVYPHGIVRYCMTRHVGAEASAEAVVREFWRLMGTNDFHSVKAVLANDFVMEWPQSNERIRGGENFARMNAEYPGTGRWRFTINRLVAAGDAVVTQVSVTDGQQSAEPVSFFEVAGGRIARLTEYWPEPFAAAANRRHLTEPIG